MGYEDNYLMHHGIKGMHWGVRRFRNYDGTLTSAGKAQRRAQSSGGGSSTTKKRLATAAKVAGAAAAVGGAAYLANRASGGQLARDAVFNARYAKEVARDAVDRVADSKAGLAARKTVSNAKTKFASSKVGKAASTAKTKIASSKVGQAASNARTTMGSAARTAKNKLGKAGRRVSDTVSDSTADVRNRLANTRAGKAYDDFRAQGGIRGAASDARKGIRSAASNARSGVGKAARRAGDTVSDRTADVRNRLANTRAGKAYDDFRAQGGIRGAASDARKGIRSAASNARSGLGKVARRAGDTVSDRTADVRNRLANTRAGKAYDDFRAQGGIRGAASDARAKASKTFNALADRGQQEMDNRAAARNRRNGTTGSLSRAARNLNSTPDARAARARTNVRNVVRNAPANARNAASNTRDRIGNAASNARSSIGKVARRAGDTVSDRTADVRNRMANTRAGKAYDDFRAQGGFRNATSTLHNRASNAGRVAKSAAKAGYYTKTSSGKKKVAEQTRKAKVRSYNRRMYGNG